MSAIDGFRRTTEGRAPHAGLTDLFAEDVVLRSPAVIESVYSGREFVATTLSFALETLEDLRVADQLASPDGSTHALIVEGRVARYRLQGCFYLRVDGAGPIVEVTFMLRPLHAVEALVSAMAAKGARPALDLEAGGE
jgi:hypothetical protein